MRKIFLENLPKNNEGRHKGCINWDKSKNKKCRFKPSSIRPSTAINNIPKRNL